MAEKFCSKTHLEEKFFLILICLVSVCNFLQWIYVIKKFLKKTEFNADFESVEKVAKRLMQKKRSVNKWPKMEFLTFITVCKSFPSITYFRWIFEQNWTQHQRLFFNEIYIKFLQKFFCIYNISPFANFKDIWKNG